MSEAIRERKMSAEQMADYYLRAHQQAIKRDQSDSLGAVIGPDANSLVNRFTDYAHRLGMKRAFSVLDRKLGSLSNRSVLDIGCGRGRWSKEYATRGARVTGADISPEAVNLLRAEMPQHEFIAADITALDFPEESFDVVNSVTVLQHMPEWKQQRALGLVSSWVKRGGYLVLLENVLAFDEPHVFPHSAVEWSTMAQAAGLRLDYHRGTNLEVLFRIHGYVMGRLRKGPAISSLPSIVPTRPASLAHRVKSGAKSLLAVASFPVEWACDKVPLASPTHSLMIFGKH